MKNIVPIICLSLGAVSSHAADGVFIQPSFGVGATSKTFISNGITYSNDFRLSYNAGVTLGYQYRWFVLNSGIGYLKTGYKAVAHMYRLDVEGSYSHVVVPAILGCRIGGNSGFTVTPMAGIYVSYNYASNIRYWSYSEIGKTIEVRATGKAFRVGYENFAVFGTFQARIEKKLDSRVSLTCTPILIASVTNMIQYTRGYPWPIQRMYGGLVELGVKWNLRSNNVKREALAK